MSAILSATPERKDRESAIKPGVLFRNEKPSVTFRQRFRCSEANLQFLNCGEYYLPPGARSFRTFLRDRESLLFMWKGECIVEVQEQIIHLRSYDTLYIPCNTEFALGNQDEMPAMVIQTSAPAENAHPVFHSKFEDFSHREDRIRRLKGKNVYMMFDVSEGADKLVAGYTFFEPYARSWPPHNHTDQEETYIFIKGHGSMEVYESPETLSFVHNVREGDAVTIPFLNYHPVFSQESPLEFIWCIAGERYWVGDKNKAFMNASVDSLTT